jgi:biopolymer transport protein ExbB/TolQ
MEAFSGGMLLVVVLFLVVLFVLWVVLPFAVFGIKRRLDVVIELSRSSNNSLKRIEAALVAQTKRGTDVAPVDRSARTHQDVMKVKASSKKLPDGGQTWPSR